MSYVIWLLIVPLILFATAAWLAVWARRDTWARPAAVALLLLGLPVIGATAVESLGWHKPLILAWDLKAGDHRVLATKMIQDKAIYLYLDDADRDEPRPLVLPWDNKMANGIQKAIDGSGPEGEGQFMMRFEPSLDTHEPQFHPLPQAPKLPPKEPPAKGQKYVQDL